MAPTASGDRAGCEVDDFGQVEISGRQADHPRLRATMAQGALMEESGSAVIRPAGALVEAEGEPRIAPQPLTEVPGARVSRAG